MLNIPIKVDSNKLHRPPDHIQVGQLDHIVLDHLVLEGCDHGDGGVE